MCAMIHFDVDKPRNCFRQDVTRILAICEQLSTLSVLELDSIHHLPHALLQDKVTCSMPEGNQWIPNAVQCIQKCGNHLAL
jgi:hypothetical protein